MYAINGVDLINPSMGWTLLRESTPVSALEFSANNFELPGRDGNTTFPTTRRPTTFNLTIKSKLDKRSLLLGLLSESTLEITHDERPGWVATGRMLSSTVDSYHGAKGYSVDTYVIEIPSGSWRSSTDTTTTLVAPVPTTAYVELFTDISAPVQDALVRFKGPIQEPQLMDSRGSFVKYNGTIPSGQYLRFESFTGRAWLTATDTWAGGDEVSGFIDFGGPRTRFEITPYGPISAARKGRLSLIQESYGAGSGVQIRGKNAQLF